MTTYLYGRGRRRHIESPDTYGYPGRLALCGDAYMPEDEMVALYQRWNLPSVAEVYIAQARNLPVCKRCLKAAETTP